jgi:hypothetical protein
MEVRSKKKSFLKVVYAMDILKKEDKSIRRDENIILLMALTLYFCNNYLVYSEAFRFISPVFIHTEVGRLLAPKQKIISTKHK